MGQILQGWVAGEDAPRDAELEAGSETRSGKLVVTGEVKVAEEALSWVTGTKTVSGDNQLIAAPASGVRIVVTAILLQNESATATTMILKDGATARIRYLGQNQGDGLLLKFSPGREWKLTAATALNLNLSGANSCGYSIQYYTE